MLGAVGIGMLFTLLPWGLLADRFDERLVIATGLSGAGVVLVLCGTTTSFVSLTLALIAAGALGASVNAASGRAIMSWFGARELGLALGIRQTAIPIGGALGAGVLPVTRVGRRNATRVFLPRWVVHDRRHSWRLRSSARAARGTGAHRRHTAAARTASLAPRRRHGDVPDRADRDHGLRRPLPSRPPPCIDTPPQGYWRASTSSRSPHA